MGKISSERESIEIRVRVRVEVRGSVKQSARCSVE